MGAGDFIYDMTCPIHGLIHATPQKELEKPLKRKKRGKTGQYKGNCCKKQEEPENINNEAFYRWLENFMGTGK